MGTIKRSLCLLSIIAITTVAHANWSGGRPLDYRRFNSQMGLRYNTGKGLGYRQGYSTAELFFVPGWPRDYTPFLDARGHVFNNGDIATNIGLGLRSYNCDRDAIFGGNLYYDFRSSESLAPHQLGLGFEYMTCNYDVRLNGYFPIADHDRVFKKFETLEGHRVATKRTSRIAIPHIDLNVGSHFDLFPYMQTYGSVGVYYLARRDVAPKGTPHAVGVEGRLEATMFDYITMGVHGGYDGVFNGFIEGVFKVTIPLGKGGTRECSRTRLNKKQRMRGFSGRSLCTKMTQTTKRHEIIPIKKRSKKIEIPGLNLFFVNNALLAGGDGTFENPFNSLARAEEVTKPGNLIYVMHGDGTTHNMDQGITLKSGQTLHGSGVPLIEGEVLIPAIHPGQLPQITNRSGDGITFTQNNNVRGIAVVGASGHGINARSDKNFTVAHSVITGSSFHGLVMNNEPHVSKNVKVLHSHFLKNNRLGASGSSMQLFASKGSSVLIEHNTLVGGNADHFGILLDAFDRSSVTVMSNSISHMKDTGVHITTLGNAAHEAVIDVSGNTIVHNDKGGVTYNSLEGRSHFNLSNNTISHNGETNLLLHYESNVRADVQDNVFEGANTTLSGLYIRSGDVQGSMHLDIKGNTSEYDYLFHNAYMSPPSPFTVVSPSGDIAGVEAINIGDFVEITPPIDYTP